MTPTELKFAALRETGVVAVGVSPPAEMGVYATSRYASLHAELLDKGLATWALTENIPAKCEQPLIWMLAFACASGESLGVPDQTRANLAVLGALGSEPLSLGEKKLRAAIARDYVPQPAQSEYY